MQRLPLQNHNANPSYCQAQTKGHILQVAGWSLPSATSGRHKIANCKLAVESGTFQPTGRTTTDWYTGQKVTLRPRNGRSHSIWQVSGECHQTRASTWLHQIGGGRGTPTPVALTLPPYFTVQFHLPTSRVFDSLVLDLFHYLSKLQSNSSLISLITTLISLIRP